MGNFILKSNLPVSLREPWFCSRAAMSLREGLNLVACLIGRGGQWHIVTEKGFRESPLWPSPNLFFHPGTTAWAQAELGQAWCPREVFWLNNKKKKKMAETANIYECLHHASQRAKPFSCFISFNLQKDPMKYFSTVNFYLQIRNLKYRNTWVYVSATEWMNKWTYIRMTASSGIQEGELEVEGRWRFLSLW